MKDYKSYCPINLGLETFGDKWSLVIIRDIMQGKRSFRELLQSEEKIATNILTDRLTMLEKEGILTKSNDQGHKQKYIFSLTEKGIDILPILFEIANWSIKYKPVDMKTHKYAFEISKNGASWLKKMRKELMDEHVKSKELTKRTK